MATVEYRNVARIYPDGTEGLNEFSLAVDDGELMVLVGPSGCGKSTALRLLAGLDEATRGDILIGGERVNEWTPQKRNVAMVFQNYALYPHMTVRKNLEFPLLMAKVSRAERRRRVTEASTLLKLTALLNRRPRQLSGGQRQRVAMGRAIVRNPSVFLMDEPLSNLDAQLRVQIRSDIAALQRRMGITTIYVTHDQVEAMTLGDRVAVLKEGRLQQIARPGELYDHPANTFVAGFIGSPGMNLFRCVLERTGEGLFVDLGGRRLPVDAVLSRKHTSLCENPDKVLIAGLRPEALTLADQVPPEQRIDGVVSGVEALGHEILCYVAAEVDVVDLDGESEGTTPLLAARLPATSKIQPGQTISLEVDTAKWHFFSAQGQSLTTD